MIWLIIAIAAAGTVLTVLVAVALGRAAGNARFDAEDRQIADLGALRSPSGKSFFADGDAVWDLADTLEDARDAPGSPRRAAGG